MKFKIYLMLLKIKWNKKRKYHECCCRFLGVHVNNDDEIPGKEFLVTAAVAYWSAAPQGTKNFKSRSFLPLSRAFKPRGILDASWDNEEENSSLSNREETRALFANGHCVFFHNLNFRHKKNYELSEWSRYVCVCWRLNGKLLIRISFLLARHLSSSTGSFLICERYFI